MAKTHLHVAFLPYPAPGHTMPMLDTVRLFMDGKVQTTVITTPLNAPNVRKHLNITNEPDINNPFIPKIYVIPFPSCDLTGLPDGTENQSSITSDEMSRNFMLSMELFEDPIMEFLEKTKPHCLISDLFFTFSTKVCKNIGIPRLAFQVTGFFPLCVMTELFSFETNKSSMDEDEYFVVPNLPHKITLTKSQLQKGGTSNKWDQFMTRAIIGYVTSYGSIFNTYYELEPEYVDYHRNRPHGSKAWHIGPVSLCNRLIGEQCQRGQSASIGENDCLNWLDSKPANSVIYLSFGTLTHFKDSQLKEIAIALENSGHNFMWVIRARDTGDETQNEEWIPDGFESRVEGRGLIIRGWAPQVLILEHKAVAAFVTHCGWNSAIEGFSGGVPMVTWPLHSEHFFIEKLVTQVLKIGVQVGSKKWSSTGDGTFINHEKIEVALKDIMVGKESLEMRARAKKLKELAQIAVKQGGSSYCDLTNLLQELASFSS
ncbi:hypothetical protein vseg_008914 [Gypsophila vaccaria]